MIKKIKPRHKSGDIRIKKHFCLLPKVIEIQEEKYIIWLLTLYTKEIYHIPWYGSPYWIIQKQTINKDDI